jgi:hypothetical protein
LRADNVVKVGTETQPLRRAAMSEKEIEVHGSLKTKPKLFVWPLPLNSSFDASTPATSSAANATRFPMFNVFPTARLRPSPFYASAVAEGMTAASIYNRMIMPTSYGDPEAEYWRLINGVSQWDVGVERQVQLAATRMPSSSAVCARH